MQVQFIFINCKEYDFYNEQGERVHGFSCRAYDPNSKEIVKVSTKKQLDCAFGDTLDCVVILGGRFVRYEVVA